MLEQDWPERIIEVLNKVDLLGGPEAIPQTEDTIAISAITGRGWKHFWRVLMRVLPKGWKRYAIVCRWQTEQPQLGFTNTVKWSRGKTRMNRQILLFVFQQKTARGLSASFPTSNR